MGNPTFKAGSHLPEYFPTQKDFEAVEEWIQGKLPQDYIDHMNQYNTLRNEEIFCCFDIYFDEGQEEIIERIGRKYDGHITQDFTFLPNGFEETEFYHYSIPYRLLMHCDPRHPELPQYVFPIAGGPDNEIIFISVATDNYGKVYNWMTSLAEENVESIYPNYDKAGFVANSFTEFLSLLRDD